MRKHGLMMFVEAELALVGITAVAKNRWAVRAIVDDTIPVELMGIGSE